MGHRLRLAFAVDVYHPRWVERRVLKKTAKGEGAALKVVVKQHLDVIVRRRVETERLSCQLPLVALKLL